MRGDAILMGAGGLGRCGADDGVSRSGPMGSASVLICIKGAAGSGAIDIDGRGVDCGW